MKIICFFGLSTYITSKIVGRILGKNLSENKSSPLFLVEKSLRPTYFFPKKKSLGGIHKGRPAYPGEGGSLN